MDRLIFDRWYSPTMVRMKKNILIPLVISIAFFCIPFFWLKPGEMDLGGDSSRLYFYDPISYLWSQSAYSITTSGVGGEAISYYGIPYFVLIAIVKLIIHSPTYVIAFFHGLALSCAFLFSYLAAREIIKDGKDEQSEKIITIASITAGIFYVLAPSFTLGWDKVLPTHNQIFLNPLMFYLLFSFLKSKKNIYILVAILVTFVFSSNFSFIAAPGFFAFYPLTLSFLFLYHTLVKKRTLPIKKIIIFILLFFVVNAFHLFPQMMSLISPGSQVNTAVFSSDAKYLRGLGYFSALAPNIKLSTHLLYLPQMTPLDFVSYGFIIFPFIVILAFIIRRNKTYLLSGIFFLISLFFVTATITDSGLIFYKTLFSIPGFSMFRNFFGQWSFVYIFFYSILLAQALSIVLAKIPHRVMLTTVSYVVIILLINGSAFLQSGLLRKVHYQSKNIGMTVTMDPQYEKMLQKIKSLPIDGKIISFPLTGPGYQMVAGVKGGVYQGPSTISYLSGKNDFTGYDGLIPFNDLFLNLARNKDYIGLERLFSLLNIKYIFHNADPYIYDKNFPKYPYDYVRDYMPHTQKEYSQFIKNFHIASDYKIGKYFHLYELSDNAFLPHFYTTSKTIYSNDYISSYFLYSDFNDVRSVVLPLGNATENANLLIKTENINPLLEVKDNHHFHVHDPFVSRQLDEFIYPFVLQNEKETLKKKENNPEEYFDYSLLLISKRIAEILKYGEEMKITKTTWRKPALWEFDKNSSYKTWESSYSRYEQDMKTLISWVLKTNIPENKKKALSLNIKESLDQHHMKLLDYISSTSFDRYQKRYLFSKEEDMFNRLYSLLDIKLYAVNSSTYNAVIPENQKGRYQVFIKDNNNIPASNLRIRIGDTLLIPSSEQNIKHIVQFPNVSINKPSVHLELTYSLKNLITDSVWESPTNIQESNSITSLFMDDNLPKDYKGIIKKIMTWRPNKQYVIEFEYKTGGQNYHFKFFDKRKEKDEKITYNTFFEKNLNSTNWVKYQTVISSHSDAIGAFLQFNNSDDNNVQKLYIRNMSVVEIPEYDILLKKVETIPSSNEAIPQISFTKLNPTKYIVHVENATRPYFLVFSEAFNAHWKIYDVKTSTNSNTKVTSYFNGDINEVARNDQLNLGKLLDSLGKPSVADQYHFIGNGYANAWKIVPSDFQNRQSYTMSIEYDPQKKFYIFFVISLIAVICSVVYLFILIRNEKK